MCYGDPMFAKNPSLGEGTGPRGGSKECRYLHFALVPTTARRIERPPLDFPPILPKLIKARLLGETEESRPRVAQWVNCDIRTFDYSVLGQ